MPCERVPHADSLIRMLSSPPQHGLGYLDCLVTCYSHKVPWNGFKADKCHNDSLRVAEVQSNGALNSNLVVGDASFTKWREFSISYSIPEQISRRFNSTRASIAVSGRNLHTWTNYKGFEPEAMFLGGSRGGNYGGWEQHITPQLTRWVVAVDLGY